jgi:catechol 2,3-dioxygenase
LNQPFGIAPPGFRLPEQSRVGALRLQVSDLGRSVHFYESVLGFRVLERTADGACLGAADTEPLVWLHAPPGVRPAEGGALGLYHFAILLPHRAALGQLARHLAGARARVGMADHLVSEAIYLSDPDGLGIEVYADRPRQDWRQDGSELVMTTEPLDVRDLLAAAGEHPWQGLPPGTRIGHVHLHVGDLTEAEKFYHRALGLDKVVWSYPGALFFSAGGYHHHLGTNTWGTGEHPPDDTARLLLWQMILPDEGSAAAVAVSLREAGHPVQETAGGWLTTDPWGTTLHIARSN